MGMLILLACLVASSLAQGIDGDKAANDAEGKFGPILCALNELQIPDNINIDLSILIGPLKRIANLLKDDLDTIEGLVQPNDPELKEAVKSIVTSLKDIISNIEEAVSELVQNPKSLKPIIGRLRSILLDVINLFTSLEKLVVAGLGLVGSGSKDASNFVVQISTLVSNSIEVILSNLAESSSSLPIVGDIFKAFNELLFPIVKRVVSIVEGALSVSIPIDLGLGALTSQVVNVIDSLLSGAIKPIVDSILPSGSSACGSVGAPQSGSAGLNLDLGGLGAGIGDGAANLLGSVLGGGSGASPSPAASVSANVINMLGALVSSPASMNIDALLGSIGGSNAPSVAIDASMSNGPNNRTKVIRPSPETVCIPMQETRPEMIETLNSSFGMPLINVGVQMSSGTSGQNTDLGSLLDLLEPLLRLLRSSINMLGQVPTVSKGLLDPVLSILQSLLTTLSERVPIDAEQIVSRLLRALVLLIGFTAVGSGGSTVLGEILRGLLLSLGQPILALLTRIGGNSDTILQAISKTLDTFGGDFKKLIGQLPVANAGGSDTGSRSSDGGGGGLLGLVGGLLNGLLG